MAEEMLRRGVGIPLLHDITDCLRVGNITFINPHKTPMTIEVTVKTSLVGESSAQTTGAVVKE